MKGKSRQSWDGLAGNGMGRCTSFAFLVVEASKSWKLAKALLPGAVLK